MESYDAIVLGVGGVGSSALFQLAKRGHRVLGIDRFMPPHDQGSTHGVTRLTRQAYHEHPDYVPLILRAHQLWSELESRSGRQLYYPVGVLEAGPLDGAVVGGVLRSAAQHNLPVEQLTAEEVSRRFPGFRIDPEMAAVFEPNAGFLMVEDCVQAHLDQALIHGARLTLGDAVTSWRVDGDGVVVETTAAKFHAARLVIAAGSWSSRMLAGLGLSLDVIRKSLYWYEAPAEVYGYELSPGFIFETPSGNFYGFPSLDAHGVKLAEHTGGVPLDDPTNYDRAQLTEETAGVEGFLKRYMPQVSQRQTRFATCLYTVSADRNFIIDRHPEFPQVAFVAGLSGHGFKFTTVLGECLADLALDGATRNPIDFLSMHRDALRA